MDVNQIKVSWYGRCCFLVEVGDKKILFDPYDTFCKVDIGLINADILISSSTWHDHGSIGASPLAHIFTYPGSYQKDGFVITGIEALEDRGSPTVIFNIRSGPFSITNFADFGSEQRHWFDTHTTSENLEVLKTTNIAFIRPSIDKNGNHDEIALNYCQPSIIFPEHYFPETFIKEQVEISRKDDFLSATRVGYGSIKHFNYPVEVVDSYQTVITSAHLPLKKLIQLTQIHPQVKYMP